MVGSALFQRSAWAGLIGGFLDHGLSLHGLLSVLLTMVAPLTVGPADGEDEEHSAMTLAGLGALVGSTLAVIPSMLVGGRTMLSEHGITAAMMITMSASMGGMLGGGWHIWCWSRRRPS